VTGADPYPEDVSIGADHDDVGQVPDGHDDQAGHHDHDAGDDPPPEGLGTLDATGTAAAPYGGDHVIGDPAAADRVWHQQALSDTCAVVSQGFALEELTGQHHSEAELAQVAHDHGWYVHGGGHGGTPLSCVGNLLGYYGVPTHRDYHANPAELHDALAHGDKCIVAVSAEDIWTHQHGLDTPLSEFPGVPGQHADHAVEVTGIDENDPAHPVVILNDPGTPDGAGERVPMDTFLEAWQASGNFLVTAGPGITSTEVTA